MEHAVTPLRDLTLVRCVLGDHLANISICMQRVRGFEKPRTKGGANQIVLREVLDEYACWECIEMRKQGISAQQGGLFYEERGNKQ